MNIHPRAGSGQMCGTGVAIMTQVNHEALFKERCLEEALSIQQLSSMEGQSTVDFQSTTTAPNRGAKAVRAVDDPQSDLAGSTHSSCISCLPPEQFLEV